MLKTVNNIGHKPRTNRCLPTFPLFDIVQPRFYAEQPPMLMRRRERLNILHICPSRNLNKRVKLQYEDVPCYVCVYIMAQLPDPDKHSLGVRCPNFRGVQSMALHLLDLSRHRYGACREKTIFQNRLTLHCTSKLGNFIVKHFKTSKVQLERYVNKISDSGRPSFATTSRDKSRWQTSTCV